MLRDKFEIPTRPNERFLLYVPAPYNSTSSFMSFIHSAASSTLLAVGWLRKTATIASYRFIKDQSDVELKVEAGAQNNSSRTRIDLGKGTDHSISRFHQCFVIDFHLAMPMILKVFVHQEASGKCNFIHLFQFYICLCDFVFFFFAKLEKLLVKK